MYIQLQRKIVFLAKTNLVKNLFITDFNQDKFLFGSDLNFLKYHNSFNKELDYVSINYFLRLSYIPSPHSIFKNFKKLKPGNYLKINYSNMKIEFHSYWSIERNLDVISYQDL